MTLVKFNSKAALQEIESHDAWKISLLGARPDFRNSDKTSGGLCFESFERKHRF